MSKSPDALRRFGVTDHAAVRSALIFEN